MALYILASRAWNAYILKNYAEGLAEDPAVALCPPVKQAVDAERRDVPEREAEVRDIALAVRVPWLWECASERIAEIEKLLEGR